MSPMQPAPTQTQHPALSLAFTLCARLCHDLAGTLGALAGTLDMAASGQDPDAMALATDCARELLARLRLLRTAWGTEGEPADLALLTAGLPGAEKLTVDLSGLSPSLEEGARRLSANLLLLAAESLPRGGAISMSGVDSTVTVEIAGPRAGWPAGLPAGLADHMLLEEAAARPRDVSWAVTCLLAGELGLRIVLDGPTRLTAG